MAFRLPIDRRPSTVVTGTIIVSCWILTATTVASHFAGRLYPSLSVGVTLVALLLAAVALFVPSAPTHFLLTAIVVLSVYYRTYIVRFPASYLGMDPDKFAAAMVSLMETGHVVTIDFQFYGQAPLFLVSGGFTGQVLGLDGLQILDVYAVVFGVFFPLAAYVIARPLSSERAGVFASLLVAVAAASVIYIVMPVAQTLAAALWFPFLFVLGTYLQRKYVRDLVLVFLFIIALVYTHKLTAILVFGTVVACSVMILARSRTWLHDPLERLTSPSTLFVLTLLTGVFAFIQLTIITDFIVKVLGRLLVALQFGSQTEVVHVVPTAAEPVAAGVDDFIVRRAYGLSLVPLAGIGWFLLARRSVSNYAITILAGIAVCVSLILVGSVSVSAVNPARTYFYAELLFVVVVAVTILRQHDTGNRRHILGAVVLVLLLLTQMVSPLVIPDHPQGERQYLTATEVSAKRFDVHVPDRIATDQYYAHELVRLHRADDEERTYVSMDQYLLNRTIQRESSAYVSYRENVRVYRQYGKLQGRWTPTYNPASVFDREYDRIYANGGVTIYKR